MPPWINPPFDQGEAYVKLRKDAFSSSWEGLEDVSHCKNLSLGTLSTCANSSYKVYAEIHLRTQPFSMISSLAWKTPTGPPQLNYKATLDLVWFGCYIFFSMSGQKEVIPIPESPKKWKFSHKRAFWFSFLGSHDVHVSFNNSLSSRGPKMAGVPMNSTLCRWLLSSSPMHSNRGVSVSQMHSYWRNYHQWDLSSPLKLPPRLERQGQAVRSELLVCCIW